MHSRTTIHNQELAAYLRTLAIIPHVETIVVDASSDAVFAVHEAGWDPRIRHVRPAPGKPGASEKVCSILTGVGIASNLRLVIADPDVRHTQETLERIALALHHFDVVRPQTCYRPMPWQALWDSARMLINRMTGGDWPATIGVRRDALEATDGYDGCVAFDALELVRTIRAAGGREGVLYDLFVARRPLTTHDFWAQRVRQAYYEFARPRRMMLQMLLLPLIALVLSEHQWAILAGTAALTILVAEAGRRRGGADAWFPFTSSLLAPLWLGERAICIWCAILVRFTRGGIQQSGAIVRRVATPMHVLRARHRGAYRRRSISPRPAPHAPT